jgi:SAM-dependent methyltransferase
MALENNDFHSERVLEVGAGFGHFLDKIADKRVPRSGITALEFSSDAVEVLREKGYRAISGDVRRVELSPGFDAIFLFQVVEHMDNLDLLFCRLSELATQKGRIFMSVPNGKKVDFQESSGSLLDMPPNHIGRWSRSALEIIAAAHGLEIKAFDVEPFSIPRFMREDIGYSYLRRAQQRGTLSNWSRTKRSGRGGKLLGGAFAMAYAPLRAPVWLRASAASHEIGGALWVEITRS